MFIGAEANEKIKLSVIIPVHNEEKYIVGCLDSIQEASKAFTGTIEVVVVLNRCEDRTEEIARSYNCVIVREDTKNLSVIRNAGVRAARGEWIVSIDADSRMSENMLAEVERLLSDGQTIGGGVGAIRMDRVSAGIICSLLIILLPLMLKYGNISVGMFWCRREDFLAIGGFNEQMLMTEDADFAKRLKKHGQKKGQRFGTIRNAQLCTSTRKFDTHGDWGLFKNPGIILGYWTGGKGKSKKAADKAYYENQAR
ncbi:galactosyltransferase-like protein [Paenibacillus cellulosilyticus]|uniref:4,4'-diaponeurosporenoate glycosyltransferase n=1 Tax=Paenibacillus cellulosilyticus TaxID=375489 RepID=A0A2V2Z071_9BACL|nr:glycosyltransferase [Paenibacillus cellulosilyticus]PWW08673.1 galactosyltransferase-like protein [Paenibacillus cellulosilyticus]QKS48239.1 glycosyltransferase [Paenibacillus cellulosilyticus]